MESGVTTSRSKDTQQAATSTTGTASTGFTDEERAALRERAHEQKAAARCGPRAGTAGGESAVRATIAAMPEADKEQGNMSTCRDSRFHAGWREGQGGGGEGASAHSVERRDPARPAVAADAPRLSLPAPRHTTATMGEPGPVQASEEGL